MSEPQTKFLDETKRTKIIQITAQISNAHHLILRLGENGIVYRWDTMYAQWEVHQPDMYKIPKRDFT